MYQAHWRAWSSWCSDRQIDPSAPRRVDLANYLAFLSSSKGLSASTVKTHRAAISTTIRQSGGPSFSDDQLLHNVVRALSLQEARSPRRFPAWDLFLVLSSLRQAPYEPIQSCSLKHLFEKTVFLVSLASGRRCSEIHALSARGVSLEPDGSYSLRFLPGFLAKNQPASRLAPPLFIKSLEKTLEADDLDVTLCPVRALRTYLSRAAPLRSAGKHRLFISFRESYKSDISVASISRWLRNVIKSAYVNSGVASAPPSSRPHEIRAWASSLAWVHNASLADIMDAAYWFGQNTFIRFYLRDVARINSDGSRGVSSAVVAQQTVSRSTQPPANQD